MLKFLLGEHAPGHPQWLTPLALVGAAMPLHKPPFFSVDRVGNSVTQMIALYVHEVTVDSVHHCSLDRDYVIQQVDQYIQKCVIPATSHSLMDNTICMRLLNKQDLDRRTFLGSTQNSLKTSHVLLHTMSSGLSLRFQGEG